MQSTGSIPVRKGINMQGTWVRESASEIWGEHAMRELSYIGVNSRRVPRGDGIAYRLSSMDTKKAEERSRNAEGRGSHSAEH